MLAGFYFLCIYINTFLSLEDFYIIDDCTFYNRNTIKIIHVLFVGLFFAHLSRRLIGELIVYQ